MKVSGFRNDAKGSVAIITAITFFLLLGAVGGAIDFGKTFFDRNRAQNVLDAGILAAASDYQVKGDREHAELTGKNVIRSHDDGSSIYNPAFTFSDKHVTGTIASGTRTYFLNVLGFSRMLWSVSSTARYLEPPAMDYALAIDISSSMRNGGHMGVLRQALEDFASEAFKNVRHGNVSVSLVPFANSVAFPTKFVTWLAGPPKGRFNGCFYQEPRESLASLGTAHVGGYTATPDIVASNGYRLCPEAGTRISFYSDTEGRLKQEIRSLDSYQGTATATGLSWAWRTLDPSWQKEFKESGKYPRAYGARNKKVVILFTDGNPYLKLWTNKKQSNEDKDAQRAVALEDFQAVCKAIQADGRIDLFVIGYGSSLDNSEKVVLRNCIAARGKYLDADSGNLGVVLQTIARLTSEIALTQ
ncbi:MAG: pilus assembly protein TadG-related protein [Hyphomicrobiaceae bacterium]